ncbi:MAG: PHP domain-containing protein [Treponema sp.]|nr:PHP domain-containing protein [Treponema sp.]
MSQYIYETHLHIKGVSACGASEPEEYIDVYKRAGYAGLIVTDHFFNGNCAIDRSLPWEKMIEGYCSGYERCLEAAKGKDFDVFFGIEYNFQGDEYLLYGIDKEWLIKHPEIMHVTHMELFQMINEAGGLMVQAHPFRMRDYIKSINLHPECVHAIEVYNAGNKSEENGKAMILSEEKDLPKTSGSDMHNHLNMEAYIRDKSFKPGGVIFNKRLTSINDYVSGIKKREHTIIM